MYGSQSFSYQFLNAKDFGGKEVLMLINEPLFVSKETKKCITCFTNPMGSREESVITNEVAPLTATAKFKAVGRGNSSIILK
jgi:hypothetical protein